MRRALLRGVSLSGAQRAQLKTIAGRYRGERASLRAARPAGAGDTTGRAAFRTRVRALRERQVADVRGVLTSAQQAVFDQNLAAWRAAATQRRAERRAKWHVKRREAPGQTSPGHS